MSSAVGTFGKRVARRLCVALLMSSILYYYHTHVNSHHPRATRQREVNVRNPAGRRDFIRDQPEHRNQSATQAGHTQ